MDLHQIIRESVDNVIWDSIISEAIENSIAINEGTGKKKNRGGRNLVGKQQNLKQVKDQNEANRKKTASQRADNSAQTGNTAQTDETTQNQQQQTVDFKPFAQRLSNIVGNGIDPSPVQNNQQAVQHITALNYFVFNVVTAINNGNIDSANGGAGGNYKSKYSNPYEKTKGDAKYDAYNQASQGIAGLAGEVGDAPINLANQWGMKLDTPFNGLGKEFASAHNQGINQFQNYANQKKYADSQRAAKTGQGGINLVYLMQSVNDGCYPRLQTEYNQINQQNNNIFSATPDVGNCYQVLQALSVAVTSYANSQKQQNTQQPNGDQPNGGQPNGGQPNVGQPNVGKVNTAKKPPIDNAAKKAATNPLDEDWDSTVGKLATLQQECHNFYFSYEKNMNSDIKNLFGWNANFLKNVISASDNSNEEQLMNLLSVNNKDDDNLGTYNGIKSKYEYALKRYGENPEENGYLKPLHKILVYSNVLRSQLVLLKNNNR